MAQTCIAARGGCSYWSSLALGMLEGCYIAVTWLLKGCYIGITGVFMSCSRGVTEVMQRFYRGVTVAVTGMLLGGFSGALQGNLFSYLIICFCFLG